MHNLLLRCLIHTPKIYITYKATFLNCFDEKGTHVKKICEYI